MAKQALTEKQKKFIDFYIQTGNASEEARQAGYAEKTAPFIGAENLQKPHIKEAVAAILNTTRGIIESSTDRQRIFMKEPTT